MKKMLRISGLAMLALLMTACATKPTNFDYTAYKSSKPRSVLILPPVNKSPDVAASLSMLSVATLPLAEAGYYVLPVALVNETFKQNGVTVAEDAHSIPLDKLRQIFGADAGLYITIDKYGTSYRLVDSVVEVSAAAKLVDLRTGAELWQGSAVASSAEGNNNNNGGLLGMLITAAIKQVMHNVGDYGHDMAAVTSSRLFSAGRPGSLLYGPYSPKYGTD